MARSSSEDHEQYADSSEFESGLDYAAFAEDSDPGEEVTDRVSTPAADEAAPERTGSSAAPLPQDRTETIEADHRTEADYRTEAIPAPAPVSDSVTPAGSDSLDSYDTVSLDRSELGTHDTVSLDRADLDALNARDAEADRISAEQGVTEQEVLDDDVTALDSTDQDRVSQDRDDPWASSRARDTYSAGDTAVLAGSGSASAGSTATGYGAAGSTPDTASAPAASATRTPLSADAGQDWDPAGRRRDAIDAQARATARDEALEGSRTGPRVLQVLLAVLAPFVLLIAAVRMVASPLFLWLEYRRPGFPADSFGFSTEDRLTYGSYGMDYLFNASSARYLTDLQGTEGPLFTTDEVSHMSDVKAVMLVTLAAGLLLAILCVIFMVVLARTAKGGIRRALFAASIWLLVAMVALAVVAALGWQTFFAGFHSLFFADGTWTFAASDTLIRLYPNQFWIDAGIVVAALVVLVAVITLICTWPTRRRRVDSREAQTDLIRRRSYWAQTNEPVE